MNRKPLLLVGGIFLAALLGGRYLSFISTTHQTSQLPTEQLEAIWCEPSIGDCRAQLPFGGEIVMRISPREEIQPMRPLVANVMAPKGWRATSLEATGLNMEMGINRFEFQSNDEQSGQYLQFLLPVCVMTRMEWQLMVAITNDVMLMRVPFHFEIER